MREYGKVHTSFWTDHNGRQWRLVNSRRRLKFSIPCHAALRAFVFQRDGFRCCRCEAHAVEVPDHYDGRKTLRTNTRTGGGWPDVLVLDHVLTLAAGGLSHPNNLQTLCETCNRRKQREDIAAAAQARGQS